MCITDVHKHSVLHLINNDGFLWLQSFKKLGVSGVCVAGNALVKTAAKCMQTQSIEYVNIMMRNILNVLH